MKNSFNILFGLLIWAAMVPFVFLFSGRTALRAFTRIVMKELFG